MGQRPWRSATGPRGTTRMSSPREEEAAPMRPQTRRRQRVRQAFLDAARHLVVQNGPAGLSLREVARQTDYSPAALYEYFENRDALLEALITEGFEQLRQTFDAVPEALPPRPRLIALGLAYIDFARQRPETFELLFTHPNGAAPATLRGATRRQPLRRLPRRRGHTDARNRGGTNRLPHLQLLGLGAWLGHVADHVFKAFRRGLQTHGPRHYLQFCQSV